jgi:hypothetical protein
MADMKKSHKMKAMLAYESTPERKAEFHAEQLAKMEADPDYQPGVPLDPSLFALLTKHQQDRVKHVDAMIAEQVTDEKQQESGNALHKAVQAFYCGGDPKGQFVLTGDETNAVVHVVKPERAKAIARKQMLEQLPDDMPEPLKEMLVAKLVDGKDGDVEVTPTIEKTPMRFH